LVRVFVQNANISITSAPDPTNASYQLTTATCGTLVKYSAIITGALIKSHPQHAETEWSLVKNQNNSATTNNSQFGVYLARPIPPIVYMDRFVGFLGNLLFTIR